MEPKDIAKLISEYLDGEGLSSDEIEHLDPDELVASLRSLADRIVGLEGGKLTDPSNPPTPEELVQALRGAADHIESAEEGAYWAERTRDGLDF